MVISGALKTANNSISGKDSLNSTKKRPTQEKSAPKSAKNPKNREKTVTKGRRIFYSKIRYGHYLFFISYIINIYMVQEISFCGLLHIHLFLFLAP